MDGQLLKGPVSREGYGHHFPELQSPGLTAQAKSEASGVHWLVEGFWGSWGTSENLFPHLIWTGGPRLSEKQASAFL